MRQIKFRAYYQKVTNDEWVVEGEYTLKDLTHRGIKFDQERIMWVQYTGLKDKNGKEIYEGDILKGYWYDNPKPEIMEIKWSDVHYCMTVAGYPLGISGLHDIEIIGNIYENPTKPLGE